ncbi:recombinase family protein [Anaeromyxobacter dehalogenans]|uniref:Resolvase-like protein n=1 Tax=Anaeromyxobacter dehalogenans (strain 2CP-C) TaxID=290397 RepID=Q2IFM7_ANADE|nr:recombinase family protein [Anaeromyxobacter dehalogenans]ABC83384.1 Resolvase-like protein [Anaeromyxobacter dehalogenans 2CP-C]
MTIATAPSTGPRFIELIRVSTSAQADRDTPEDQRAALKRLRLSRPGMLVETIEFAVSGAKATADRPDIRRLAQLADEVGFDEVRVRHLDRLTRHADPDEQEAVFGIIRRAHAVIVEADGSITDPRTMTGRILAIVRAEGAAEERRKIVERTVAGKRRAAQEGRLIIGFPPYGRRFDKMHGWTLDPERAEV